MDSKAEAMEQEAINGDVKEEPEDEQMDGEGGPEPEAEYQVMDAIEDSEAPEADQKGDEGAILCNLSETDLIFQQQIWTKLIVL